MFEIIALLVIGVVIVFDLFALCADGGSRHFDTRPSRSHVWPF